ncbi:type II toxin-antitoxin system RelB/DinJ family antitoxin, partial [Candidatus Nomurabacteria bacterium]|nr:type II toxin-antitoxin system RelB/DinJ family antitoxin [Candidatus Nomurabacteria bacterium]
MNTVINIRIDKKTKDGAQKTLESMGLDLTSGIKMFLNQVVTENRIPFTPSNKRAKRIRARWDKEV